MELNDAIDHINELLRGAEHELETLRSERRRLAEGLANADERAARDFARRRQLDEERIETLRSQLQREFEALEAQLTSQKVSFEKELQRVERRQSELEQEKRDLLDERDTLSRAMQRLLGADWAPRKDATVAPLTDTELRDTLSADSETVLALLRDAAEPMHESEIAASMYPDVMDVLGDGEGLGALMLDLESEGLVEYLSGGRWRLT